MKQSILILILIAMLSPFVYSQNNNAEHAKQVQSGIKALMPGFIPVTSGGYMMSAKINGKQWTASSMMPPEQADRIVGDNNGESIGLPYDRRDMVVGNKIKFSKNNAVDLFTNDGGILGGREGEMEITKVKDGWAEGKFFFNANSLNSNKTAKVTDGLFRVSLAKR